MKVLIRLRQCTGKSVPLMSAYDKNRFSHDMAHMRALDDQKVQCTVILYKMQIEYNR